MKKVFWLLIPALLGVIAIAAEPPQQNADHPTWAFLVPDATPPAGARGHGAGQGAGQHEELYAKGNR